MASNSSNNKIGIAVVGTGYWGKNYVRSLNEEFTHWKLLYVIDSNESLFPTLRSRHPNVNFTTRLEDALEDSSVLAAVIATPASTHYNLGMKFLRANKHVLVEKPLSTDNVEAAEMVSLAKEKGLVLMVGFTVLFINSIQKAKEVIKSPDFGEPYYLYSRRLNLGIVREDVSVVWDLAPHDLALFAYWTGTRPDWVSAVGAKYLGHKFEDAAFIHLSYGGVIGSVHISWADPKKERECVFVGSKMRIAVDDINVIEPLKLYHRSIHQTAFPSTTDYGEFRLQTTIGDMVAPHVDFAEPLKNQCRHFYDCILGKTECIASGRLGYEITKVLEAIEESIKSNGAPIYIKYD